MTATGVAELHDIGVSNGESTENCAHSLTKSISPFHEKYRSIHKYARISNRAKVSFSFAIGHCYASDDIVLADCTCAPTAFATCGKSSCALYLGGM